MRRALTILGLAVVLASSAAPGVAADLEPLMAGWERHFTVDWQSAQYAGQPIVEGYVTNVSPYETTKLQLLVETLDGAGRVTGQQVAWLPGELLGGGRGLITKIRQLFPRRHVPVLAVTGHPFPADGVRRAGFDAVMLKPPDPDKLCAAVAALLRDAAPPSA